ncbi:alkaline phosphatase family protein [Chloroflexota bacterium]
MARVLVIGLDGATFDLIEPWADEGKLPCLGDLMKNGVWGNLRSVIPSMSAPAWVSFMTGKNPGKHGILDFVTHSGGSYLGERQPSMISSRSFKDRTLWEILGAHGRRVGVVSAPITYPPKKVNGFLISCFMTPPSASIFTYPQELAQAIPDYRIGIRHGRRGENGAKISIQAQGELAIIKEYHDITEKRTSVALRLMEQWDPDFSIIVYKGTDEMQHFFWGREDILLEFYQKIDKSIASILAEGDKDTDVIIISDHGFGPEATKRLAINGWLEQVGLLKRKRDLKSSLIRTVSHLAWDLDRRTGLAKRLPPRSVAGVGKALSQGIAWHQTKAYGCKITGIAGININLRGREPQGIVKPGQEYEQLREEIIAKLRRLTDPESGERVMSDVYKNNEIYWGSNLGKTPDIVGIPTHKYRVGPGDFAKSVFAANVTSEVAGAHFAQPNGILLAHGPHIKTGERIEGAHLIDIAPTVLHMMGLPVPQDMDGRVLKELFKEESEPAQRDVEYQQLDVERERVESKITNLKRSGKI